MVVLLMGRKQYAHRHDEDCVKLSFLLADDGSMQGLLFAADFREDTFPIARDHDEAAFSRCSTKLMRTGLYVRAGALTPCSPSDVL
jgi:hypothetical protein